MREFLNYIGIRSDWSSLPRWLGGFIGFSLVSVGIIFSVLFFIVLIVFSMTLFTPLSEGLQARAESIRNVGLVVAAFIGFPFLIWRSWVAANQAQTSSEALFNDKITDAAKDLSARKQVSHIFGEEDGITVTNEWQDDIVVRAMAIHRLEGLANERQEFSPRIARMLASYIRGNFPAANVEPTENLEIRKSPRMDLQDAVDALSRILKFSVNFEKGDWRIDLTSVDFDGVNFSDGFFRAADFRGSRLEAALLDKANFQGAWFHSVLLNYASFRSTDFTGANLTQVTYNKPTGTAGVFNHGIGLANLKGVDLSGADLSACAYLGSPKKVSETFGNGDTKLARRLRPQIPTSDELETAFLYRNGTKTREHSEEEERILKIVDDSGFQNWSPYANNDGVNYSIKLSLMDKLGLNKWPYIGL